MYNVYCQRVESNREFAGGIVSRIVVLTMIIVLFRTIFKKIHSSIVIPVCFFESEGRTPIVETMNRIQLLAAPRRRCILRVHRMSTDC